MTDSFYAHSKEGEPPERWQPLEEHLRRVAASARSFADEFGAEEWGYLAGLWHDLGKYSIEDRDANRHAADSGRELLRGLIARVVIKDVMDGKDIGIDGNHLFDYRRTLSMISSMLPVPKATSTALRIVSAGRTFSSKLRVFSILPSRYRATISRVSLSGFMVTSNYRPCSAARSGGSDRWPSGRTLPMNVYVV